MLLCLRAQTEGLSGPQPIESFVCGLCREDCQSLDEENRLNLFKILEKQFCRGCAIKIRLRQKEKEQSS